MRGLIRTCMPFVYLLQNRSDALNNAKPPILIVIFAFVQCTVRSFYCNSKIFSSKNQNIWQQINKIKLLPTPRSWNIKKMFRKNETVQPEVCFRWFVGHFSVLLIFE